MPNAERALRGDEHWDVFLLARRPDVRHATQTTLIMRLAGQPIASREHSRERFASVDRFAACDYGCDEKVTCI